MPLEFQICNQTVFLTKILQKASERRQFYALKTARKVILRLSVSARPRHASISFIEMPISFIGHDPGP